MCGIAGILNLNSSEPVSVDLLSRMIEIQRHRGPDESGIYVDDNIGLGHARLSIIDLTGGRQPIHNEDQSLWIIYNGEVFNYPELRKDLVKKGHRFYTESDTEVILHLYEEKGIKCLDDLNGQFAFAIWDVKRRELFMVRDRTGIVPLHYSLHDGKLIFASEIKAILLYPDIPRELDLFGLDQIFTFWSTLPGRTIFNGIQELPAGYYLSVAEGRVKTNQYWDFPFSEPEEWNKYKDFNDIIEESGSLLKDAIRLRLRADVPVGSYLSGGIDSSGLTALISGNFDNHLRTFGITFEEKDFDESIYQNSLVSYLDVEHSAIEARNEDIRSLLKSTLWHCEKPLLRTAPVPLFLLSKLVAKSNYKVVVTGEGADEVFGGYNIFKEAKIRAFWAKQPKSSSRPLLLGKLYPYIFKDERLKNNLSYFFGRGLEDVDSSYFSHMIRWNNTSKIKTFFSVNVNESLQDYNSFEEFKETITLNLKNLDPISRAQYLEMKIFMSTYLLSSQGDRVTMANSVESRPPYLDHRLIEFMGKIPPSDKIRGLNEKYILKKILKDILPDNILSRSKHPYRAPIRNTVFGSKNELIESSRLIEDMSENGIFDKNKVKKLIEKSQNNISLSEIDKMALSGIITTGIICKLFLKKTERLSKLTREPHLIYDQRN